MKTQAFIFYGALLGLVATLFNGCAIKERPVKVVTVTETAIDGTQTTTTTTDRNSVLKAYGYKLDLSKFNVKDVWQEGGDAIYEITSDGAKADPESQVLKGFNAGFGAASTVLGRAGSGTPPELQAQLDRIDAKLTELDRIASALESNTPTE